MPNPFEPISPERLAAIYRWPPVALRFLAGEGDCLHVMGQAGMGKTALLRQIELRLAGEGQQVTYTCVPIGGLRAPEVSRGRVTLVDEADRLRPEALRDVLAAVKCRGGRIVLGTHRNLLGQLRKSGLTWLRMPLRPLRDTAALAAVFTDRIRLAGFDSGLAVAAADALLRCSRGNIERVLQIGYEVFESLASSRDITEADIRCAAEVLDRATAPPPAARAESR